MKKKSFHLMILSLLLLNVSMTSAQFQCVSSDHDHNHNRSLEYLHRETRSFTPILMDKSYCLNINIYEIQDAAGNSNLIPGDLEANFIDELNSFFSGTDISFQLNEYQTIKNTGIYNTYYVDDSGFCYDINPSFYSDFSSYSTSNIDVFVHGNFDVLGFADGYASASRSRLMIGYQSWKDDDFGIILAHEMGHVLGLFHLRHGTLGYGPSGANESNCENNDGFVGHIPECPLGSELENASKGDYVGDTPAVNSVTINTDCIAAPEGAGSTVIAPGCSSYEFPTFPGDNYMLSNLSSFCSSHHFTPGQITRMKFYIDAINGTDADLAIHDAVFECPTTGCRVCELPQTSANNVYGLPDPNIDGCTITLSWPALTPECIDAFEISWGDGTPSERLLEGDASISHTYSADDTYDITIAYVDILEGGSEIVCDPFVYPTLIDGGCSSTTTCEACEDLVDAMIDSLDDPPFPDSNCNQFSIEVPDLSNCYRGVVLWQGGTAIDLESDSFMFSDYTETGTYLVRVKLYDLDNNFICKKNRRVDVVCEGCPNPCDIDAFFEYGTVGGDPCVYRLEGDNLLNDCDTDIYNWQWTIDGTIVSSSSSPSLIHTFEDIAGFPTITLTISYFDGERTCEDSYTVDDIQMSCPPQLRNQSILYPNPTSNNFSIVDTALQRVSKIEVRNVSGHIVYQSQKTGISHDVSKLQTGLYFVIINYEDGTHQIAQLLLQK